MFSKKATQTDKIFTVDLTLTTNGQINGEDFVNFCGFLRKYELYLCLLFSADIRTHMCLTGCFKAKGIVLKGLLNTTLQSEIDN